MSHLFNPGQSCCPKYYYDVDNYDNLLIEIDSFQHPFITGPLYFTHQILIKDSGDLKWKSNDARYIDISTNQYKNYYLELDSNISYSYSYPFNGRNQLLVSGQFLSNPVNLPYLYSQVYSIYKSGGQAIANYQTSYSDLANIDVIEDELNYKLPKAAIIHSSILDAFVCYNIGQNNIVTTTGSVVRFSTASQYQTIPYLDGEKILPKINISNGPWAFATVEHPFQHQLQFNRNTQKWESSITKVGHEFFNSYSEFQKITLDKSGILECLIWGPELWMYDWWWFQLYYPIAIDSQWWIPLNMFTYFINNPSISIKWQAVDFNSSQPNIFNRISIDGQSASLSIPYTGDDWNMVYSYNGPLDHQYHGIMSLPLNHNLKYKNFYSSGYQYYLNDYNYENHYLTKRNQESFYHNNYIRSFFPMESGRYSSLYKEPFYYITTFYSSDEILDPLNFYYSYFTENIGSDPYRFLNLSNIQIKPITSGCPPLTVGLTLFSQFIETTGNINYQEFWRPNYQSFFSYGSSYKAPIDSNFHSTTGNYYREVDPYLPQGIIINKSGNLTDQIMPMNLYATIFSDGSSNGITIKLYPVSYIDGGDGYNETYVGWYGLFKNQIDTTQTGTTNYFSSGVIPYSFSGSLIEYAIIMDCDCLISVFYQGVWDSPAYTTNNFSAIKQTLFRSNENLGYNKKCYTITEKFNPFYVENHYNIIQNYSGTAPDFDFSFNNFVPSNSIDIQITE